MSIVIAIAGISLLILLHEWGHYVVARACGMRVLRFSIGFGPALIAKTIGDTTWQLAAIPLGGYVLIDGLGTQPTDDAGESAQPSKNFNANPIWQRVAVIVAGPAMNWLLAVLFIACSAFTIGSHRYDAASTVLGQIVPQRPAHAAGLLEGDRIVSINQQSVGSWQQLVSVIEAHPGQSIDVRVERGDTQKLLHVTPGNQNGVGKIGVAPMPTLVRLGLIDAVGEGVRMAMYMTQTQASLLWNKLTGQGGGAVSGLPGIVKMVSTQAQRGLRELLETLSWLSIGLFLLNMAPIPALDGGRLVFLALEMVRVPLNQRVEGLIHGVSFLLLLGLMIVVSVLDLI